MKKLTYNQFQSAYQLENGRYAIVDFLHNSIRVEKSDVQPQCTYDQSCEPIGKRIDHISDLKGIDTLSITIIFNLKCNMNCVYCYETDMCQSSGQKNDPEAILVAIKKLLLRKEYKLITITFLGGEPILKSNFSDIEVIIQGVKKLEKPTSIGFISNGLDVHKYIDRIKSWGMDWMQITLDGTEVIHNNRRVVKDAVRNGFIEISAGLQDLVDMGVNIDLRINIDRNNVDQIGDLGKVILEKGWDSKILTYLYPVTLSSNPNYVLVDTEAEIFEMLLNALKKEHQEIGELFQLSFHGIDYIRNILYKKMPLIRTRFCGVANGQFVLYQGKIYSCWWALNRSTFQIGSYERDNCKIIPEKESFFRRRCTTQMNRCMCCKFKYICGGGCTFKEYTNFGTLSEGNCAEFDRMIGAYLHDVL